MGATMSARRVAYRSEYMVYRALVSAEESSVASSVATSEGKASLIHPASGDLFCTPGGGVLYRKVLSV
jgi:hypothetical protein